MQAKREQSRKTVLLFFGGAAVLLFFAVLVAVSIGSVHIGVGKVFRGLWDPSSLSDVERQILWNIRVPRILIAILIGSALSMSGCLLQAVMQNPLADPGIIGVSSGASLGAIIILILLPEWGGIVPIFSFFGAAIATVMVYILAWKGGIKPVRLILSGVAINALLGGGTSLISILNSDKIQSVLMFLNGSLAGRTWKDFYILLPYVVLGWILSVFTIRSANLMMLGDEKATNLGLNVSRSRVLLSALGAFLAAVSTCLVGVIGFIGLVIPHIGRLVIGSDHKRLVPFSILLGAIFLLVTDTFARSIASPLELPVGTIMSVVGVPFFLYLLRRGGQ